MPKMRHPDTGRTVSVSGAGVQPLQARGYTLLGAPAPSTPETPAASATKAEWVEYALTQGVEDPDSLTKAELQERLRKADDGQL